MKAAVLRTGIAIALLAASSASADQLATITQTRSIPVQTTSWNETLTFDMFDTNLGALESIKFVLNGRVEGAARFESRDASPTTVTVNLSSSISLLRPDNTALVVSNPAVQVIESVGAFDGTIDFGGSSGRTFTDLGNAAMEMTTLTSPFSPGDLALFAAPGGGLVNLPVHAVGTSNATGSGNLVVLFNTQAGGDVTVVYTYKIPEPATMSLMSLPLLLLLRRRA